MNNRVPITVYSGRFYLITLSVIALMTGGCESITGGPTAGGLQPDQMPSSIAASIHSEAERVSGCTNGEVVVADIDTIYSGYLEYTWLKHPFWEFSSAQIGPEELGLLVRARSGSAVGNDHHLVYRIANQELVRVGKFQGSVCRLSTDRVNNGLYDIYTMWHTSSRGGPYKYHRWTGSSYESYKSGDTEK